MGGADIPLSWLPLKKKNNKVDKAILYPINKRGVFGFIDKYGNQKIDFKYNGAKHLKEDLAPVKLENKWGYIDKEERTIIDFKYFYASKFDNGQAKVALKSNKYYWIDKEENKIHPSFQTQNFSSLWDLNLGKSGFMDSNGNVVGMIYESTKNPSEGFAPAKKNGKWGFVNENIFPISEFEFDEVREFKEGLVAIKKNQKWGFMNTDGQITIKPQFKDVRDFVGELCLVKFDNQKWSYISKSGKIVWQKKD